jgi:hypothetical protein
LRYWGAEARASFLAWYEVRGSSQIHNLDTSELIIHPVSRNRDTLIVGAAVGLTAGLAMAFWGMLTSVYHGVGLLSFFDMIGATFLGADPSFEGAGRIAYGVLLHAGFSAGLGVLFTALLPQTASHGYATAAGLGFGLAILLAMTYVITPAVNPFLRETVSWLPKSWIIQHALFGLTLGYAPIFWRLYHEDEVRVRIRGGHAVAH